MKKIFVVALVLLVAVGMTVTAVSAVPKVKPPTGAHYNLNIIGKKWDAGSHVDQFDNYDRHTIFIPINTENFFYTIPDGENDIEEPTFYDSIGLRLTQAQFSKDDFDVVDGNAFDDGWCWLDFPDGYYTVWMAVKAKGAPDAETAFTSTIYYENETDYFLINIGEVKITKSKGWTDATDLLYVDLSDEAVTDVFGDYYNEYDTNHTASLGVFPEGMWLFDYIAYMEWVANDSDYDIADIFDAMAFWDIKNTNNKLIQLRFYER